MGQLCNFLKACSHEPGTVNYPGVMIAPGQALPRVHMMICCPGETLYRVNFIAPGQALPRVHMMICCPGETLSRVNFIAPGQVHRHLITTNLSEFLKFLHRLLQRMSFKHVYLFLVLSRTFYWKIYSKH